MTELVEHYETVIRLIERTVTSKMPRSLSLLRAKPGLSESEVREIAGAMARGHLVWAMTLRDEIRAH